MTGCHVNVHCAAMTGCRVSVHFIGGRMPKKGPGRAARLGRRPGKPGNTSGPGAAIAVTA